MAEVLETTLTPINEIKPHPENARRGNIEMIKESLQEHQQYRAIVVRKQTHECLAGNHTLAAAKELGLSEILVSWVDVPEDEDAMRILLVDNRANDVAGYDDQQLVKALEPLMLSGRLKGTGYTPDNVDDMLARMDQMPEVDPGEFKGDYAESADETAQRYPANEDVQPMKQFVLLYPMDRAAEIEAMVRVLQRAWGIDPMKDIVAEALRRVIDAEDATPAAPAPVEEGADVPVEH